jgi:hypothetical protein
LIIGLHLQKHLPRVPCEGITIGIVRKDISAVNTAKIDVMQRAGGIDLSVTRIGQTFFQRASGSRLVAFPYYYEPFDILMHQCHVEWLSG